MFMRLHPEYRYHLTATRSCCANPFFNPFNLLHKPTKWVLFPCFTVGKSASLNLFPICDTVTTIDRIHMPASLIPKSAFLTSILPHDYLRIWGRARFSSWGINCFLLLRAKVRCLSDVQQKDTDVLCLLHTWSAKEFCPNKPCRSRSTGKNNCLRTVWQSMDHLKI